MNIGNRKFYLIMGFILSIGLVGILCFVFQGLDKSAALKELSNYYHSLGENQLSDKYMKAYIFFRNLAIFILIPLISLIKLISNIVIKKKKILLLQFFITFYISGVIFIISDNFFNHSSFKIDFFQIFNLIFLFYCIKDLIYEVKEKKLINKSPVSFNLIENIYLLFLIGFYFLLINWFHNYSDLFFILVILSSLFITLCLPYVIKILFKKRYTKKHKSLMFVMLIFIFILIINTSLKVHKYSTYYNHFPNQFVLNKDTSFDEPNSDSRLNKTCDDFNASVRCFIWNSNDVFNDYYFDTATININSESAIQLLNNTNYQLELYFFYRPKANKQDVFVIDDYTLTTTEDGYSYNLDLNHYLNDYPLKDFSSVTVELVFIDPNTNQSITSGPDDFISNYEITLTKY